MGPSDNAERARKPLRRVLAKAPRRCAADFWDSQLVRHFSSSGSTAGYLPVPIALDLAP